MELLTSHGYYYGHEGQVLAAMAVVWFFVALAGLVLLKDAGYELTPRGRARKRGERSYVFRDGYDPRGQPWFCFYCPVCEEEIDMAGWDLLRYTRENAHEALINHLRRPHEWWDEYGSFENAPLPSIYG